MRHATDIKATHTVRCSPLGNWYRTTPSGPVPLGWRVRPGYAMHDPHNTVGGFAHWQGFMGRANDGTWTFIPGGGDNCRDSSGSIVKAGATWQPA